MRQGEAMPPEESADDLLTIREADGSEALFNRSGFEAEVKRLTAITMTVHKITGQSASIELARISHETQSPVYVRRLIEEVGKLAILYAIQEAGPVQVPVMLSNLHGLILAYRRLRPTESAPFSASSDVEKWIQDDLH